ncbi:MAG TPA: hypothetical protein VFZ65_15990 [Planctomycetota bacterium]|nr:hypothetical protein [Planctomycetota bacterium]
MSRTTAPVTPSVAAACIGAVLLVHGLRAQDQMRGWGVRDACDTEAFGVPVQRVSASPSRSLTMVLTADGRVLAFGENHDGAASPPQAPAGLTYTHASACAVPIAELSNGQLVQWSPFLIGYSPPSGPPSLPPGLSWVDTCSSHFRSFALRSDGVIVSWGTTFGGLDSVPPLAAGLSYTAITASGFFAAALVSDGSLRAWGSNNYGVQAIPALPAGVTYTEVHAGYNHLVALRSDGQVVAWGDNYYGQCNVPTLPAGLLYVDVAAGGSHNLALRSDGQWLAWGWNDAGQCNIPAAPPGTYVEMFGGLQHTVALRADGFIESWGRYETPPPLLPGDAYRGLDAVFGGALTVTGSGTLGKVLSAATVPAAPSLPTGVRYEQCSAGGNFWVGLASDGMIRAWGANLHGQLAVPALPPGLTYVHVDAGEQNAVALRSNGTAVAWGDNSWGQTNIPPLPPGQTYLAASAGSQNVLLLRSDGNLVMVGTGGGGILSVPALQPGLRYTGVACGWSIAAAMRSDGTLASWGGGITNVPPLPAGLSYVEVECADNYAVARRSDGVVVTWGHPSQVTPVPFVRLGRSFLRIAADVESSAGLIGSASRYVPSGAGCAGSLPPSRLIPRDTPQIGRTLPLLLTNLPTGTALMVFGWNSLRPGVSLTTLGMPGCRAHVSFDAAALVSGPGTEAQFALAVPYDPMLVGLQFANQALVFDPAAGNPFAAVVSEAMLGTIGG